MATANSALRISELDFDSIKNNLKNYLRSQSEFQDFDFEGSGMSVLLDILAYNTHYMGYYLNMVGNEMFLDTAQLRNSVLSHAKNLNYIPDSSHGALVKTNILVTPSLTEDQVTNVLTLDRYTKFLAQDIDGTNYQFVAVHSNTVTKTGGTFLFANTYLQQGEIVTLQFAMDPTNTSRRFEIPSANVDIDTLSVTVQESASNTSTETYIRAEDITSLSGNSAVYFVEENPDLNYIIYFGDNVIGKQPKNGNIITVNFLNTVGSAANNISKFFLSDVIGGLYRDNVSITATTSSYGGTDKEALEQVRFRAPYFYTTQNRAVTVQDYQTLITKDYNNIDSVAAWGGEDNEPVVYGKVFLSLKTKNNYALSEQEKLAIIDNIIKTRSVLTVTPEIVDPDYGYLLIKGTVYYNPAKTTLTSNQIRAYVQAALLDYRDKELNQFSSTFRQSRLQNYIENSEQSITGTDLTVYLQKRLPLTRNSATRYVINYNTSIQKGDYNNRIYSNPEVQVYDSTGISRTVYFEESPISSTGIDSIKIISGGINYTTAPTVTVIGDGSGATLKALVNGNQITSIQVLTPGTNYTKATISIGGPGSGAIASAKLQLKTGVIRSYYLNSSGEKVIVNSNVGSIDYETGQVIIYSLYTSQGTPSNRYYDTDVVAISAPLEFEIITPLRNRILTIDENDPIAIQIDVVAEK